MPYFDVPWTSRPVVHDVFDDVDAELAGDGWEKPMHLAVEVHRLDDLGAKHLQRAAVVVQLDARRARNQPVRDRRRQSAVDERVLAVFAPAGDDVRRRALEHIDHGPDVARIVLQIAVHRDDVAAAGARKASREAGGLPEVAPEANDTQAMVGGLQQGKTIERVVFAAIVNRDDLVRTSVGLEGRRQLAIEPIDIGLFVLHRNDDRDVRLHGDKRLIIRAFEPCRQTAERSRRRFATIHATPNTSAATPTTSATCARSH